MIADDELKKKNEDNEDTDDIVSGVSSSKKGFEESERLTLRIDALEADKYQKKKTKSNINRNTKNPNKIKTKVRQIDDEDDEDEDLMDHTAMRSLNRLWRMQMHRQDSTNSDTSLVNALESDERRQIMQNITTEVTRQEENAGRHNALAQADKLLKKANLEQMNTQEFMNEMKDAIYNPSKLRREALANNIAKQMGIKGEIVKHSEGEVVEGVRKVKALSGGRKVDALKMDDVKKVGEKKMTQNETAELILRKSGQTARLSEIKHQSKTRNSGRGKGNKSKSNKSYSAQMKELLKESLKKNDKIGR
jgi:hypothetical protein